MKNPLARKYISLERKNAPTEEYEKIMNGALKKAVIDGDKKEGCFMIGLTAALIDEIKPLDNILAELFKEAEDLYQKIKTDDVLA